MEKEKKQDYYVVRIFNDAIQVAKSFEDWTNSNNMFIEAYNVTVNSVEKYQLGQIVDRKGEIKSPEPVKEIVEKIALRDELAAKEETEREAKEEAARKAKKAEELENARKEEERKRKIEEKEKERTKSDYKFVLDILSSKNQDLNPYAVGIVSLLIPQMGLYMRKRGLIDKGTDLTQGHFKKVVEKAYNLIKDFLSNGTYVQFIFNDYGTINKELMSFINKLSNELKIKNLTPEFFINAIQSLHNPRTMMRDIIPNRRKPAMRISKESASFISDICEESSTRTLTAEQCQALFNELTGRAQLPNPRQELLSSLRDNIDNTNSELLPTSGDGIANSITTPPEQEQI